jgi:hypothetical protein
VTSGAAESILPKQIEIEISITVKHRDFLFEPFKKLKIFGSISSSAIELIMKGALWIYCRAEPELERMIPM